MTAFSGEVKGTLESCYDELRDNWFDEIVKPPALDYLILGMCVSIEDYAPVVEALDSLRFQHHRFVFKNRSLWRDGVKVGWVRLSNGVSRYGRKLLFHFTGEWFRGGCDESLAWFFRNKLEESIFALSDYIEHPDWVLFTEVCRLDLALEVKKAHRLLTPTHLRVDGPTLPAGIEWREHVSSHTGITDYASKAHDALANRAKKPLLRLYSEHDVEPNSTRWTHGDTMRIELEFPAVQRVDGTDKLQEYVALAAQVFQTLTPWEFISSEDLRPHHREAVEFGQLVVVPAPNWEETKRPEDFTAEPWTGHPAREVERLFRCGTSITYTALGTMLMVALMQDIGASGGMFDPDEVQPSFSFHESMTEREKKEVLELLPAPGYTVEDLAQIRPPDLAELDKLELMIFATRRYFYPDSVPAVIDRNKRSTVDWVDKPSKWVEKFLTPVRYPERQDTPWEMGVDGHGMKYLRHTETGEIHYPGSMRYDFIARAGEYNLQKRASKTYELREAAEEWTSTPAAQLKKAQIDEATLNVHRIIQGEAPRFMNSKDRLKYTSRKLTKPEQPKLNFVAKFENELPSACGVSRQNCTPEGECSGRVAQCYEWEDA